MRVSNSHKDIISSEQQGEGLHLFGGEAIFGGRRLCLKSRRDT